MLSEIKAYTLIDTLADRLTDVEIETLAETVPQRFFEVLMNQLAYELRTVNFESLNETRADVKAQALVDTGRHTSTSRE